ncbi:MAG TPA: hypothetical protein VJY64_00255 [Candidatus Onthovivens sp.]|nr:hypothetical protein [Candidatus Onthovivens sp.]
MLEDKNKKNNEKIREITRQKVDVSTVETVEVNPLNEKRYKKIFITFSILSLLLFGYVIYQVVMIFINLFA